MKGKRNNLILLLYVVIILQLASCKTQYIPIEKIHNDTIYHTEYQYDSIYLWEKHNEVTRNDTVYITNEILKYKEKHKKDTVYQSKFIQVPKPYEVVKKVPYIPKAYQWSMMFSIMVCIISFFYFGNKLRNIKSIRKWFKL